MTDRHSAVWWTVTTYELSKTVASARSAATGGLSGILRERRPVLVEKPHGGGNISGRQLVIFGTRVHREERRLRFVAVVYVDESYPRRPVEHVQVRGALFDDRELCV